MLDLLVPAQNCEYELPGRTWVLLLGPQNCRVRNVSLGLSIFPPGSAPTGHVHDSQEEVVYVLEGHGRLVTEECVMALNPGNTVYIPPGVRHSTEAFDDQPLRLLTVFSPPVEPGSYEPHP